MEKLILLPQFIDPSGNVVYDVHEADPECRTLRPGDRIAQVRFDTETETFIDFEPCTPLEPPHG